MIAEERSLWSVSQVPLFFRPRRRRTIGFGRSPVSYGQNKATAAPAGQGREADERERVIELLRMAKVLFEGTKTFWKTKSSVNLTIVEHHGHDVIEVVAYEPAMHVEAPRLYLEIGRIIPLLDQEAGLLDENDAALATAISNFIFNRLRIAEYLPTSKVFVVDIQRGFGAKEQGVHFQLSVERPVDLVRHSVSHSGRYK
jgi:hypothetical protein